MEVRIDFLQLVIIMPVALFKLFIRLTQGNSQILMSGAVTFNVTNCLIDFYQRQGIDCRGSTLTADISNSMINRGYVLKLRQMVFSIAVQQQETLQIILLKAIFPLSRERNLQD
jgi:hypothetical protein